MVLIIQLLERNLASRIVDDIKVEIGWKKWVKKITILHSDKTQRQ
jgi:Fe-S cluster biosynthesis and repair protein YggX